jgi:hypothetical protein
MIYLVCSFLFFRLSSIPTEAASICDATSGCYEIGPNEHSIYLGKLSVPEFPLAIPILVIGLSSMLIFFRIKFKLWKAGPKLAEYGPANPPKLEIQIKSVKN